MRPGVLAGLLGSAPYDVILLAGQSNMAGRGTYSAGIDTTDANVFQWGGYSGDGTYQTVFQASDRLKHPEIGAQSPGVTLVGPGMFFAKAYAARTGRKVLLVPAAWGGTSLVTGVITWSPYGGGNDRDYLNAIAQANAAIAASKGRFVGTIWLQGEGDGANLTTQTAYESAFTAMLAGLRSGITGAANSWFVLGQMMPEAISAQGGTYAGIDAAHKRLAATLTGCAFAAIGTGYNSGDNLHYNAAGARLMGTTMEGRVTAAAQRTASTVPGAPLALTVGAVSSSAVPLTWDAPASGGITTDYVVQYALAGSGSWNTFADGTSTYPTATVGGLAASTSYDFRVAASNAAGQGAWSSTVTASTAAAVTISNVRLTTQTLLTETGDGTAGYSYTAPNGAAFTTHHAGTSDKKLAAGTDGLFRISLAGSSFNTGCNTMLGVVLSQTDPAYTAGASGYKYAVYNGGAAYTLKQDGSATSVTGNVQPTYAPQADDIIQLRRSGGTWVAEVARSADPTNFVLIHTFAATSTADAWCAVAIANTSGSSKTRGPVTGGNVV